MGQDGTSREDGSDVAIQTSGRELRCSWQTRAAARFRQEATLRLIGKGVKMALSHAVGTSGSTPGPLAAWRGFAPSRQPRHTFSQYIVRQRGHWAIWYSTSSPVWKVNE
jgi:hypothetical protein